MLNYRSPFPAAPLPRRHEPNKFLELVRAGWAKEAYQAAARSRPGGEHDDDSAAAQRLDGRLRAEMELGPSSRMIAQTSVKVFRPACLGEAARTYGSFRPLGPPPAFTMAWLLVASPLDTYLGGTP